MDAVILYSTWPDQNSAVSAARALLDQRLIACANVIPGAVSLYRWQEEVRADSEVVMFAKTTAAGAARARDALQQNHPHALPCVVAIHLSPTDSSTDYLTWIEKAVASPG